MFVQCRHPEPSKAASLQGWLLGAPAHVPPGDSSHSGLFCRVKPSLIDHSGTTELVLFLSVHYEFFFQMVNMKKTHRPQNMYFNPGQLSNKNTQQRRFQVASAEKPNQSARDASRITQLIREGFKKLLKLHLKRANCPVVSHKCRFQHGKYEVQSIINGKL